MLKGIIPCFIILFFVIKTPVFSQKLRFEHLSVSNGLSNGIVNVISQDSIGFIWLGTQDGLNRFDGTKFEVYTHKPGDTVSLSGNSINDILCDGEIIWVASTKGIDQYLWRKDVFRHIPIQQMERLSVTRIFKDFKNRIIICTTSGLFIYDSKAGLFKAFKIPGAAKFNNGYIEINSICQDSDSSFWFGTNIHGLFHYQESTGMFTSFPHFEGGENTFLNNKIFSIFADNQHTIWAGTNLGLYAISKKTSTVRRYLNNEGLPHMTVNQIFEDSKNNLYIATNGGLSVFNRKNNSFQNYYHDDFDPSSLSTNSIRCVFEDIQKNVWIGSGEDGLNISKTRNVHFESLQRMPNKANGLNYSFVLSILEDRNGNLWIGTNGGGVNFYDKKNNKFSYPLIPYANEYGRRAAAIKALFEDKDGNIWIGTYMGGVVVYNPQTGLYKTYNHTSGNPNSISHNDINYFFQDSRNQIWICTDGGIDIFNPANGKFSHINTKNTSISSDFINYIFEDNEKQIWVGTYYGLNKIDPVTMMITSFLQSSSKGSLSSDIIFCIHQDSKNRMWFGTDFGLNLYDKATNTFKVITSDDGLPNNNISCILEDNRSNLWISTNKGIARYDLNKERFTNYTLKDGLVSLEYYRAACFKGKSGFMYFGGTEGLTFFNPDRIKPLNQNIPLVFTNLYIFNQTISPKDNLVLDEAIVSTDEVNLNYDQSYISVEFASLNFVNSAKDEFSYFLEGFDQQWNQASVSRMASYTKLPPGNYTLHVKAINENGSEVERSLRINVHPPFWKSIWAYILYVLLLFSLLYFIYKYLHSKTLYKHSLQLERIEKEKAIEFNQAKIRFFINVSHDFKTPLTLIISPLEQLISKGKEFSEAELNNLYHIIYRNTLKLSRLINQIMDLRRLDTGNMKLNVSENDIVAFVKELSLSFQEHARQHHIEYNFETREDTLMVWYDTDKIEKVIFNILSNAFRYTSDGKKINILIDQELMDSKPFVRISIIDQGQGIPEDQQDKVFSRFYQVQTETLANPASSGVGLSIAQEFIEMHHGYIKLISKVGVGSTFSIYIPLGKDHFRKEDFLREYFIEQSLPTVEAEEDNESEEKLQERKKYKILIVEDNFELRNFLVDSLKNKYNVLEAANGKEGLEIANENLPDLIVSDVMMPKMTGIEMCKAIKSDIRTSHIPVILLTVLNNINNQIEGFGIGADDYITKPFNLHLLDARILNLIEIRKRLSRRFMEEMKTDATVKTHNHVDERFMQKALDVVEQNIANVDFSAEDFAAQIGISRSNLHVKLKALTNQSATEFIRLIRLKKSIELLSTHRYNISEVSYMIGFNSISYFNRCFKQQFGITPSEFLTDGLKN